MINVSSSIEALNVSLFWLLIKESTTYKQTKQAILDFFKQVEVVKNGYEISNVNADISENTAQIAGNVIDIASNANAISNNDADIQTNSAGISIMGDNIEALNVSLFLHLIKEAALNKQYFFCNNYLDLKRNCMII